MIVHGLVFVLAPVGHVDLLARKRRVVRAAQRMLADTCPAAGAGNRMWQAAASLAWLTPFFALERLNFFGRQQPVVFKARPAKVDEQGHGAMWQRGKVAGDARNVVLGHQMESRFTALPSVMTIASTK